MRFTLSFFLCISLFGIHAQDTLNFTKTEIIYGRKDGMALTMLKLSPKKESNGKAIINVVSGNWISNYGMLERFVNISKIFINSGYTVFVTMHGSQPRYTIPDEIADLKRAIRFIRYNAKDYHIDGNRIGITGESSGGHLSLMAGLSDDKVDTASKDPVNHISSRVQAVAVFFPPTDFLDWGNQSVNILSYKPELAKAGVAAAFDFKEWNDNLKVYIPITDSQTRVQIERQISPIYSVTSDDPPVLIIHGDADPIVPLQQSEIIIKKLNEAGVPNKLIIKKGGGHGWKYKEMGDKEVEEKNFVDWFDKYLK